MRACSTVIAGKRPRVTRSGIVDADGSDPASELFPFVVALNGHSSCSGTLIAPSWVLMAAHCVDTASPSHATFSGIIEGPSDRHGTRVPVAACHMHPAYTHAYRRELLPAYRDVPPEELGDRCGVLDSRAREPTTGELVDIVLVQLARPVPRAAAATGVLGAGELFVDPVDLYAGPPLPPIPPYTVVGYGTTSTTGSSDYPTTAGAYDASFAVGGGQLSWTNIFGGYGYSHNSGCDIFIRHFNVGATALVGSTLVGGTGQDGLNNNSSLTHNYGDHFRGEIALDANEDPVVATTTFSLNMPTTPGAPQAALSGSQDGFVFRMNPALTNLLWATYIGGPGEDSAFGVQFDSNGNVFVTGGTTSAGLPMPGASADNTQNGGADGSIMK